MRYAAIDIGTNSCRLLLAEIKDNKLISLFRDIKTTRIGEGLHLNGKISEIAMERTFVCLNSFLKNIVDSGISSYRIVATSAVREASNQKEFLNLAKQKCGIPIEIISAEDEAHLSYLGVKKGLDLQETPLVVDLGGGSTEFIMDNGKKYLLSLPLGAVRATESNMSIVELAEIISPLARNKEEFRANPLVFVGGTATSLVAIKKSMLEYQSELVHGQTLSRREIADIYDLLERLPLRLRQRLPGLQEERADIMPKGALVVLLIIDSLEKESIKVSESDLLDGIIWKINMTNN